MKESESEFNKSRNRSRSFCVPTAQPWLWVTLVGKTVWSIWHSLISTAKPGVTSGLVSGGQWMSFCDLKSRRHVSEYVCHRSKLRWADEAKTTQLKLTSVSAWVQVRAVSHPVDALCGQNEESWHVTPGGVSDVNARLSQAYGRTPSWAIPWFPDTRDVTREYQRELTKQATVYQTAGIEKLRPLIRQLCTR
jgi:hypothetical protein